jgi:hypothetical protein
VIASVARYNRALGALHDLRARFAAFVERQHTALEPGSEIWAVGRVLSKLEADIASRQSMRMGSNVVGLQTLEAEIGFLERYHAYLAAVTRRAEKIERASACNDGTLDLDPED